MQLHATSVATVPLVMFISGFVASLTLERTKFIVGRKITFPIGCLLGVAGCMWIFFGCEYADCPPDSNYSEKQIYGVAVLMGAAR
jgi:hypothetical protein